MAQAMTLCTSSILYIGSTDWVNVVPSLYNKEPTNIYTFKWKCEYCECLNPDTIFKCDVCGAPRKQ